MGGWSAGIQVLDKDIICTDRRQQAGKNPAGMPEDVGMEIGEVCYEDCRCGLF